MMNDRLKSAIKIIVSEMTHFYVAKAIKEIMVNEQQMGQNGRKRFMKTSNSFSELI